MDRQARPDSPVAYVAASAGGAAGAAVGIGGGWAAALALERPEAGMSNLLLLVIPFTLLLVALPAGTYIALRLASHPRPGQVAVVAGAFTVALAAGAMTFAGGWLFVIGAAAVLGAPALALRACA